MSRIDEKPILHGRDHMSGGVDPIPGMPTLSGSVSDIILSHNPDAFWKLNETTGAIANDSSGNDHHLTQAGGLTPPTWGQEVAPTGDTSALFDGGNDGVCGFNANADVAMSAFTNNFTAGIWVSFSSDIQNNELIGQGFGGAHNSAGWTLGIFSGKLVVYVGTGSGIEGDNTLLEDTWYFAACVRDAGTFKIYVNGLEQADTMTTSFSGSTATIIGNDNFTFGGTHNQLVDGLLSYGFIIDAVLSGQELLDIYETGATGGSVSAGKVWTSDGSGGASWEYPTIEVEF